MPNRNELVVPRPAPSREPCAEDDVAWTLIWICMAGWLISVYVAVASQSAELIPVLIAQSAFG